LKRLLSVAGLAIAGLCVYLIFTSPKRAPVTQPSFNAPMNDAAGTKRDANASAQSKFSAQTKFTQDSSQGKNNLGLQASKASSDKLAGAATVSAQQHISALTSNIREVMLAGNDEDMRLAQIVFMSCFMYRKDDASAQAFAKLWFDRVPEAKQEGMPVGDATLPQRLAAATQLHKVCSELHQQWGGRDEDIKAANERLKQLNPEKDALVRSARTLESPEALSQVLRTEPLTVLYTRAGSFDYSSLNDDVKYTTNIGFLLNCRFGMDCSTNGIETLRACIELGACGSDLESNLKRMYVNNGLDWNQAVTFVNRVQAGAMQGDVSIFRRYSQANTNR
jgi:hypothetical protein